LSVRGGVLLAAVKIAVEDALDLQTATLLISIGISIVTLALLVLQTRSLSKQTKAVAVSLEYSAYLKLVDYLNDVNMQILENPGVRSVFAEMDFVADSLRRNPELSVEKIALAWLLLNRYEAAYVGRRHGVISEREWGVWTRRLKLDLQIGFIHKVWMQDINNFDYDSGFVRLIEDLVGPAESRR
jgi:hypothetical protein